METSLVFSMNFWAVKAIFHYRSKSEKPGRRFEYNNGRGRVGDKFKQIQTSPTHVEDMSIDILQGPYIQGQDKFASFLHSICLSVYPVENTPRRSPTCLLNPSRHVVRFITTCRDGSVAGPRPGGFRCEKSSACRTPGRRPDSDLLMVCSLKRWILLY